MTVLGAKTTFWTTMQVAMVRPYITRPMPIDVKEHIAELANKSVAAVEKQITRLRRNDRHEVGLQQVGKSPVIRKIAPGINRKCSQCHDAFEAKSPFIRRCDPCKRSHIMADGVDAVANVRFR